MKIKKEDYDELERLIKEDYKRWIIPMKDFWIEYEKENLSFRRFCFDILYGIPFNLRHDLISKIYTYANDDHIFTALKKIIKGMI